MGLSARAISDLERGLKRSPRDGTIDMLADALQLSTEERHAFKQVVSYKRRLPTAARPATRLPAEPTPTSHAHRSRWSREDAAYGACRREDCRRVRRRRGVRIVNSGRWCRTSNRSHRLGSRDTAARVSLGDVRFEAAWRHGGAMSMDEAIALALSVVP